MTTRPHGHRPHVVIIGAGISGLATAYYLQKQAEEQGRDLVIHLVDRAPRAGGVISTVREDGFIVEGGPDSMLSYKPAGVRLLRELGLAEEIVGTSRENAGSFVYSRGELHPLPEGLTLMIPSKLGPLFRTRLISWRGKARAALNILYAPSHNGRDISVAEFVEDHLGRETFERIVEPLFAGIYAGDARQLSLAATYPQLLDLERDHGSLLRGLILMRHRRGRMRRTRGTGGAGLTPFITLRTGLARLVEALVDTLERSGVIFHLGRSVERVERRKVGDENSRGLWRVYLRDAQPLDADVLVLALPAHGAARILQDVDVPLAHVLRQIPYASSATVSLAYRREDVRHPLKGYGFVVPRVEGRPLLACTWTSSKFPHRAPRGYVLFRTFFGRAGADDVVARSESDLIALARSELREIMGIDAVPTHAWAFRWQRGLPQYTVGHLDRVHVIEERTRALGGLYLVGNAYRGVGIPDCIANGERVAREIVGQIAG
ncbi:MAG: protoporphyrinogen oxidase [Chloroflexi bacterium]|nr:protoporphyrinogen oxidase [Chloroflexota bacterium]